MHPDIKHLIELQVIDLRLNELRALVASFPKRLAEIDARAATARQQLATVKETLITSLKDRKRYELDVEQWKDKLRKYKDQTAAVKTNEAYKALQHEIANAERERAVATIPEDLLDHYQRIARRHNGVALAEVRDETCMLCRVRVRPHVYQELRRETSHEIFHCESCTRILYYTDQPVAQAPMAQTSEG